MSEVTIIKDAEPMQNRVIVTGLGRAEAVMVAEDLVFELQERGIYGEVIAHIEGPPPAS